MEVEFSSKGISNFLYMEKNISYSFRNEIDKNLDFGCKPYLLLFICETHNIIE